MWNFDFLGGNERAEYNGQQITRKFFLFAVSNEIPAANVTDKVGEDIFFNATKKGLFCGGSAGKWDSHVPIVKVFCTISGFGVQKKYSCQYVDLSDPIQLITMRPIQLANKPDAFRQDIFFSAKGRLLRAAEVQELVGEESMSFRFFKMQSRFSREEIPKLYTIERLSEKTGSVVRVRKLII